MMHPKPTWQATAVKIFGELLPLPLDDREMCLEHVADLLTTLERGAEVFPEPTAEPPAASKKTAKKKTAKKTTAKKTTEPTAKKTSKRGGKKRRKKAAKTTAHKRVNTLSGTIAKPVRQVLRASAVPISFDELCSELPGDVDRNKVKDCLKFQIQSGNVDEVNGMYTLTPKGESA